ncbi:MAG: YmdB family metallophosphoesterase [Spirochaetaceae bacterium]|nr:YmdB family metallophosphoesterase [Spirochaetaceae bacterium]
MAVVKALMIGDVVGDSGLDALEGLLPAAIREYGADFVVVNGENAAKGFGLTEKTLRRILSAGADMVTSGNHVWEKREFWPVMEKEPRILRPANYPAGTVGRGWALMEKAGVPWVVINLQGREQMTPIDCPFRAFDAIFNGLGSATASDAHPLYESGGFLPDSPFTGPILVDFHAESTREKEALGYFIDGRASLIAGTHTHVQTADERILPRGSGYITDLGMTGVAGAVIGMDTKICLDQTRTQVPYHMEPAKPGPGLREVMTGVVVEIDRETGRALSVARVAKFGG